MKKKPFDPFKDKMPLMPLWGADGKLQDNSNPSERDKAEAAAEMEGDRRAAGLRPRKKRSPKV